jgi:hypothetical protein
MQVYCNKGNFSEVILPKSNQIQVDKINLDIPSIDLLADGEYKGLRYGYTLELEDGSRYRTLDGVRNNRSKAKLKTYIVSGGKITCRNFSGLAEVSGALQGASYGRRPKKGENVTRVEVDSTGFRIPESTKKNITNMSKSFANPYTGYQPNKSILPIKDDSSIIKSSAANGKLFNNNGSVEESQPNRVRTLNLDWDNKNPFHLGVEPWITSPVVSDTDDGIYVGTLSGETFKSKSGDITLGIKLSNDFPETVLGLVKGKKIYLFKSTQLLNATAVKSFSDVPCDNCTVELKSNGKFGIRSANGKFWSNEFDSKDEAVKALNLHRYNVSFADTDDVVEGYSFDPIPKSIETDRPFELSELIGTVVMSVAYAHLYHLCTSSYAEHKALEDYYKEMPEVIDELAEHYLANVPKANFTARLVPDKNPIVYFESLSKEINKVIDSQNSKVYTSNLESVRDQVSNLLYKLKRLDNGIRSYSISSNIRVSSGALDRMIDSITDAIQGYFKKYKKSPIESVPASGDRNRTRRIVKRKILNGEDLSDVVGGLGDALKDTVKLTKVFK